MSGNPVNRHQMCCKPVIEKKKRNSDKIDIYTLNISMLSFLIKNKQGLLSNTNIFQIHKTKKYLKFYISITKYNTRALKV